MPETLEKKAEEFVKEDGERIEVNWDALAEFKERCGYDNREVFRDVFDDVLADLTKRGILGFSLKDSFILVGCGINLNPKTSYGQDHLNFTREKDARDYARAFYGNALNGVSLLRGVSSGVNRTE